MGFVEYSLYIMETRFKGSKMGERELHTAMLQARNNENLQEETDFRNRAKDIDWKKY